MTECECHPDSFPFECRRHGCVKAEHWFNLCQTRADYFQLWEEQRGPGQQVVPGTPPCLARRIVNFFWAVVRHIRTGRLKVKRKTYRQRLAICQACDSLDRERMVCTEKKCGCFVERKALWASQECPLGKWKAVSEQQQAKNLNQAALESGTVASI